MTPSEIRALRKKLKLSPADFGVRLGFAEKSARITVWRWETVSGSRRSKPSS
jgi:DNA-binding transcriptional regulator YiaG